MPIRRGLEIPTTMSARHVPFPLTLAVVRAVTKYVESISALYAEARRPEAEGTRRNRAGPLVFSMLTDLLHASVTASGSSSVQPECHSQPPCEPLRRNSADGLACPSLGLGCLPFLRSAQLISSRSDPPRSWPERLRSKLSGRHVETRSPRTSSTGCSTTGPTSVKPYTRTRAIPASTRP